MYQHRHLDDELNSLRDRVLLLGGEAEAALERAMKALTERDSELARQVLENDDRVDRLEVEIDRQCIDIIALRQPAARDLRFVISVAKDGAGARANRRSRLQHCPRGHRSQQRAGAEVGFRSESGWPNTRYPCYERPWMPSPPTTPLRRAKSLRAILKSTISTTTFFIV